MPIPGGDAGPPEERILELRVHGVSNTPPASLLEVDEDDVEKVRGDSLGSFWTLTPTALEHAHKADPTHHDHIRRTVHREAYSWGQMARNSATAPAGASNEWVQRLSRAGWMFLVPLGLANTAYWSRRLSRDPGRFARGAGPIRVFGLGLTVLVVMAFSTVSLDLIATQCFAATASACPSRPAFLTSLETLTWTQRLAVMSLVPVAVLLFLLWLSAGSRVRYEEATSGTDSPRAAKRADDDENDDEEDDDDEDEDRGPAGVDQEGNPWTLAHASLWSRWSLTNAMAQLHVAAGLGVLVMVLAAAHAWGPQADCRNLHDFIDHVPSCSTGLAGAEEVSAWLFLGGAIVEASTVFFVWRAQHRTMHSSPTGASYRAWTRGVLVVAVVLFVAELALLVVPNDEPTPERLVGLSFFPATVVVVLLLIALIATTWRARPGRTWIATVGALLVAVPLWYWAVKQWPGESEPPPWTLVVAAAAGIVLIVAVAVRWRPGARPQGSPDPRVEGWRGTAPAVLLVLSLGAVVMLTSLVVVVAGDWLNGSAPVPCLDVAFTPSPTEMCQPPLDLGQADDGLAARMLLPPMYPMFTVTLPVGLALSAVMLAVVTVVRLAAAAKKKAEVSAAATGEPRETLAEARRADYKAQQAAGSLRKLAGRPDLTDARRRARRLAAAAKYSERVLGAVALAFAIALIGMILISVRPAYVSSDLTAILTFVGIWLTVLLWSTLLLRVVTKPSGQRPAGLLWDLICFLPRSAHPFGPPCYAERVVPELAGRVSSWLAEDRMPDDKDVRRVVVISAHSLGAVLAVATLFTLPPDTTHRRVGLLTYGAQLRPYFGRFFPEFLGPQVLGTDGCNAPRLTDRTPWPVPPFAADGVRPGARVKDGVVPPGEEGPEKAAQTLMAMLRHPGESEPAWINLWRATDPLGMPVASDVPNFIDRAAEELDATSFVATVGKHGGYPRTTAYRRAFDDVVDRLG
ncbi:hypothetical protein [Cellulomonas sp. Leaf334]|uniref:hypothetical protein n=1 Tax=Cellulomonas sp. Leaf334 TaxID=1736339 RepID=UPI000AD19664|nr:hypothetical protein [Cellulomonas sp. Leaf334]